MEKMSWTGQITSYYNPVKCTYFLCIIHMEHNPIILSLALKTLDQNCNFLLTQKNFGQLGKIKWNFSNSLLIGLLKIIVKVFLYILVDCIKNILPAIVTHSFPMLPFSTPRKVFRWNPDTGPSSSGGWWSDYVPCELCKESRYILQDCNSLLEFWCFCVHSAILVPGFILEWMNYGFLVEYLTVSTLHQFTQLSKASIIALYI